ncbi:MAG: DUF4129 domain-containing protein [Ardenticatenaceae bacterium]|nr:DUF4129 domain-containing protein [Ardenticatenaceae bacterium]
MLPRTSVIRHALFLLLILVVGSTARATAQEQRVVTYAEYVTYVRQAQSAMRNNADCAATAVAIANTLHTITAVQLPDGSIMPVSHVGATTALNNTACSRHQAVAYLDGLIPGYVPITAGTTSGSNATQPSGSNANNGQSAGSSGTNGSESVGSSSTANDTTGSSATAGNNNGENGTSAAAQATGSNAGTGNDSTSANDGTGTNDTGSGSNSDNGGNAANTTGSTGESAANGTGDSGNSGTGNAADGSANGGSSDISTTDINLPDGASAEGNPSITAAATATTAVSPTPSPAASTTDTPQQSSRNRALLIIIIVAIAVVLIGVALFFLFSDSKKQSASKKPRSLEEVETADEALDLAGQLANAGQYREAVRHLFLAALLTLAENRAITLDQSLTNHELLIEARRHPALAHALQPVVYTFDRVWYGYQPLTPADYETAVQQIAHLEKIH